MVVLSDPPGTARQVFLPDLDRLIFQRCGHGIIPAVEESEQRYHADDFYDLLFVQCFRNSANMPSVTALGSEAAASAARSIRGKRLHPWRRNRTLISSEAPAVRRGRRGLKK